MKILVDTNIIMDSIIGRQPFFDMSDKVIKICADENIDVKGYLSAHSVTNLFYLLRKYFSNEDTREILIDLFTIFDILQVDSKKIKSAILNRNFKDFEDCLQVECAKDVNADFVITRNLKDFSSSTIPCILPSDFCKLFD